jgi:hypothetical protein
MTPLDHAQNARLDRRPLELRASGQNSEDRGGY